MSLPSTHSLLSNEDNPLLREIRRLQKRVQQLETRAGVRSSMANANSVNVIAGEGNPFNSEDPFTGSAMLYPAFSHSTGNYHIIGMNGGTLQFGLSADDGKAYAGGGNIVLSDEGIQLANSSSSWFRFEDAGGTFDKVTIACDPNNDFEFTNLTRSPNGTFTFFVKDTAGNTRQALRIQEDPANNNVMHIDVPVSTVGSKISLGGEVVIWGGKNSVETVFNDGSYDIDERHEGATDTKLLFLDGGLDAVAMGGDADGSYKLKVHGSQAITSNLEFTAYGSVRSATLVLSDDTATSFTPTRTIATIQLACRGTGNGGLASYNTTVASCDVTVGGANFAATTGTLSGTTGTDGKLTVSAHTDGKIYVENRLGVSRTITVLII